MKVYLDDVRPTPEGWVRTYTVEQTIDLLKSGEVTEISLDHDLGKDENGKDLKDGYEVLTWIEEQVFVNKFVPPIMYVHSANAVGQLRMRVAINRINAIHEKNIG